METHACFHLILLCLGGSTCAFPICHGNTNYSSSKLMSLRNRKHILNTLRVFLRLAAWSVETHARFLHCSTLWRETHVRFHVFFDFWRETHACFLRLGFLWWETQARFQIQALQRRETLFFRFSVWKSLIQHMLCLYSKFFTASMLAFDVARRRHRLGDTVWSTIFCRYHDGLEKKLLLSTEKLSWHTWLKINNQKMLTRVTSITWFYLFSLG